MYLRAYYILFILKVREAYLKFWHEKQAQSEFLSKVSFGSKLPNGSAFVSHMIIKHAYND